MFRLNLAAGLAVGALLLVPRLAQAHFILNAPTNWWNQDPTPNGGGAPQKTPPCGDPASEAPTLKATNVVNVYQAGQPVTVTVTTTVAHQGWWRISLHQGAAATQTTANLPDPPTAIATGPGSCTPAFITNPVWSPTQPVLADKLGIPAGSNATNILQSGTLNFQVTIPATAQCTMAAPCTLQVMMIMTDHDKTVQCNYHHCANMAAGGGTTGSGGTTGTTDAGTSGQGGASAGTGGKTGAGGAMSTGTGGSMVTGAGGASTGTAGMTGSGSGGAMAGSGGTNGGAGSTTTGAGGVPSGGGQGGATGGGGPKDNGGGCAIAGSAVGSSGGLIFLAILALRRRRAKK